VTDIDNLREAVIAFVSIAGEKLRKQGVEAGALNLFITTGPFDEQARYSNNQTISLSQATSSTPELIAAALQCLKLLYRPGYRYRKAGVMLAEIVKKDRYRQQDLFSFSQSAISEDKQLMTALDRINGKWGRQTIQYGMTTAENKPWMMQQTRKSPAYTTNWHELPVVKTMSAL
jgi:DNA polymerase V